MCLLLFVGIQLPLDGVNVFAFCVTIVFQTFHPFVSPGRSLERQMLSLVVLWNVTFPTHTHAHLPTFCVCHEMCVYCCYVGKPLAIRASDMVEVEKSSTRLRRRARRHDPHEHIAASAVYLWPIDSLTQFGRCFAHIRV